MLQTTRYTNDCGQTIYALSGTFDPETLGYLQDRLAGIDAEAIAAGHGMECGWAYGDASEDGITMRGFTLDTDAQGWEGYAFHEINLTTGEIRHSEDPGCVGWTVVLLGVR